MHIKNKYRLDHETYIATKRLIVQYPRLSSEYDAIVNASPIQDGQPRGSGISDPTGQLALKLMGIGFKLDCITRSLKEIPDLYRQGIFNHIVYKKPFPDYAGIATWRRWQYRYVFYVWRRLNGGA